MAAYQVSAEDEEKFDSDPAEAIDAAGQLESEQRGVVNDDHDDGEPAEKIETRLAFAILKARIYHRVTHKNVTLTSFLSRTRERRKRHSRD